MHLPSIMMPVQLPSGQSTLLSISKPPSSSSTFSDTSVMVAPQSIQKRLSSGTTWLQDGHSFPGISWLQWGHSIFIPSSFWLWWLEKGWVAVWPSRFYTWGIWFFYFHILKWSRWEWISFYTCHTWNHRWAWRASLKRKFEKINNIFFPAFVNAFHSTLT